MSFKTHLNRRLLLFIGFIATAVLVIITAVVFFSPQRGKRITLRDSSSGRLYAQFPAEDNSTFSIEFVHSVNQTPVKDIFSISSYMIRPVETVFFTFGAGMQTDLADGQILTYHDDGSMSITGFDSNFDQLHYIVGTVSDHVFRINDTQISLRDLCGRNTAITIKIE